MLFNSIQYLFFLPLIFALYWLVNKKSLKLQNILLLAASYYFYACWDWRFLFLLMFSTGLDYYTGLKMHDAQSAKLKKFWFWLSIGINVGFLGVFKYYNFFVESFADLLSVFGFQANFWTLQVILPVGISFYTFHGLSYVIDIYKNRIEPERNIVDYSLFVSYFPLLVAGPIERATHLLPQIKKQRQFNYSQAIQGVKQIVWGLFKKVVIADNCAFFVNQLFENSGNYSAPELWLGAVFFAFQIYGDFSGYSDIALGTSKLFGIELLKNFNFPYFSKDIADFWRRWHISLSTWFRDYLYIPLGGSQGGRSMRLRNTLIIFLVSGFWHGANWTFILWGLLHALLFIPLLLTENNRKNLSGGTYTLRDIPKIILTFLVVCLAWVFFRADNVTEAFAYLSGMFDVSHLSLKLFFKDGKYALFTAICLSSIFFLLATEWRNLKSRSYEIQLSKFTIFVLLLMIFFMGSFKNQMSFIYFQF
ncbi:MBOAT family O-acyltransferase [Flavobacterium enshiense]|uniref:MBOAT family O-acyltransferase n=1 Tax=Flavobacterium enshiense TaxID=1341165 RepID=UPI00345D09BF